MSTDTRPLKILLAFASGSLFVLAAVGAVALLQQQESVVLSGLAIAFSALCSFSLLALWIYWIVRLWRNGQTTELLLCFILPYVYAVYMTIKILRSPPAPSTGISGGA